MTNIQNALVVKMKAEKSILGKQVKSASGQPLGFIVEIQPLYVRWSNENLDYDLLLINGILEDKSKWVVLPIQAFEDENSKSDKDVVIKLERGELEGCPSYDSSTQPKIIDFSQVDDIYLQCGFKKFSSNHTII